VQCSFPSFRPSPSVPLVSSCRRRLSALIITRIVLLVFEPPVPVSFPYLEPLLECSAVVPLFRHLWNFRRYLGDPYPLQTFVLLGCLARASLFRDLQTYLYCTTGPTPIFAKSYLLVPCSQVPLECRSSAVTRTQVLTVIVFPLSLPEPM